MNLLYSLQIVKFRESRTRAVLRNGKSISPEPMALVIYIHIKKEIFYRLPESSWNMYDWVCFVTTNW